MRLLARSSSNFDSHKRLVPILGLTPIFLKCKTYGMRNWCNQKRGWRDGTTNLTPKMGLSRVASFLIFWDRPLSLTLSLQIHLRIFLHAFTDLWTGTTHTLTNQHNRKPNSKLTPCLSWKSPESTIFMAPVYSSKIKHLLRYGLWGQSSRCSLDPLSL
jgi:hypothetical protein